MKRIAPASAPAPKSVSRQPEGHEAESEQRFDGAFDSRACEEQRARSNEENRREWIPPRTIRTRRIWPTCAQHEEGRAGRSVEQDPRKNDEGVQLAVRARQSEQHRPCALP